jgi:cytochrome c-type biogenesis protein CcmH/NrfG
MKLKRVFPVALLDMGLIAQKIAQKSAQKAAQRTETDEDDWNRAAGYFAQFVALEPSDVGYLLLANALRQGGRPDDANLAYQQAQRLSNDIAQAQQRAAQLSAQ